MAEAVVGWVGWVGWELCLLPRLAFRSCLPETLPQEEREELLILPSSRDVREYRAFWLLVGGTLTLFSFKVKVATRNNNSNPLSMHMAPKALSHSEPTWGLVTDP